MVRKGVGGKSTFNNTKMKVKDIKLKNKKKDI